MPMPAATRCSRPCAASTPTAPGSRPDDPEPRPPAARSGRQARDREAGRGFDLRARARFLHRAPRLGGGRSERLPLEPDGASFRHQILRGDLMGTAAIKLIHVAKRELRMDDDDYRDLLFRTAGRSEEHTSELQYLMRISYAVICLKTKTN